MYGFKIWCEISKVALKFHTKIWTHASQNMDFMRRYYLTVYDMLELWHCTGPRYVCHEVRSQYIVNKHKSKVLNYSNI